MDLCRADPCTAGPCRAALFPGGGLVGLGRIRVLGSRPRRAVILRLNRGIHRDSPVTLRASLVTHRDPLVNKDCREDTVPIHPRSDCHHPSTPPYGMTMTLLLRCPTGHPVSVGGRRG